MYTISALSNIKQGVYKYAECCKEHAVCHESHLLKLPDPKEYIPTLTKNKDEEEEKGDWERNM